LEIKPTLSEFKEMAGHGNWIPVYAEYLADLETPVSAFLKVRDDSFSYLLESATHGKAWGRYSFIGYKPGLIVSIRDNDVKIRNGTEETRISGSQNPLEILKQVSRRFKAVPSKALPAFQGGLVGYINYDLVRRWEHLPELSPEAPASPECLFMLAKRLIIFDHLTHKIKIVAFVHGQSGAALESGYDQACREVADTVASLSKKTADPDQREPFCLSGLHSNFTKADFEEAVLKAKGHILSGDVIQVVLSQRFSGESGGDDFCLYRNLRSLNPSPYMFYLNYGDARLIGASPESLARLTNGKIELRPIAGTRPRGEDPQSDVALEKELLNDPKEKAEHIMLVDLGRNDVGRMALPGSVVVPQFMKVERYSHVMHLVSQVEGTLVPRADCFDLFMSVFPAGTVTGAPKIRAMQIIAELEPGPRGPYAGAVGYFGFNGNMDFCITIRTIAIMKNTLSLQVGAGIVYDSSPEKEYHETLEKAAAMFQAIERAKNDFADR